MEQLSNNVMLLNVGDQIPVGAEDSLKIFLTGSIDLNMTGEFNWQDKFIKGFLELVDPQKGMLAYNKYNYIIINSYYAPKNAELSIFNQEMVQKQNWEFELMEQADAIFCNFLKKSKSPVPLFWFGYASRSQKLLVRCPDEYMHYGLVRTACEKFNIPLVPGKIGSIGQIVAMFFSFIPRFQEITKNSLPE